MFTLACYRQLRLVVEHFTHLFRCLGFVMGKAFGRVRDGFRFALDVLFSGSVFQKRCRFVLWVIIDSLVVRTKYTDSNNDVHIQSLIGR